MKNVLIIGAARSGIALAELLNAHDYAVTLIDTKSREELSEKDRKRVEELEKRFVKTFFEFQPDGDFAAGFDIISPSPGVPETIPVIERAIALGIPIISEVEFSYLLTKASFVAITGTNGKTTTTTLTGKIFEDAGEESFTLGNIGEPISLHVDEAGEESVFITELGSFQLSRCYQFSPRAAAILNITPDHLDRHGTMENYISAKARITQNQDGNQVLVLNADDPNLKEIAKESKARVLYFSSSHPVEGAYLKDDTLYIDVDGKREKLVTRDELGIKGIHNVENALAASLLAYVSGIEPESIRKTLKRFQGVPHRQERVLERDGVLYINDSKGTNTEATMTALRAMERPVVLIAGGYDKKEDYTELSEIIRKRVRHVALLGETRFDIKKSLDKAGFSDYTLHESFEEAVKRAVKEARPGETVLLSPACASWDMFDNYETRGEVFKKLVKEG